MIDKAHCSLSQEIPFVYGYLYSIYHYSVYVLHIFVCLSGKHHRCVLYMYTLFRISVNSRSICDIVWHWFSLVLYNYSGHEVILRYVNAKMLAIFF